MLRSATASTPASSALSDHPLFENQPDVLQMLAPSITIKQFGKDDAVIHHGDEANYLWLVLHGWVKLTRQTPDGKESVTGLCTQGDLFGKAALFPHANYPYNAQVLTADTQLAMIPSDVICPLVAKNASLSATIMALLNSRTRQAQLKLEQLTTLSAAQRLGCFLLHLCQHQASGHKVLQIPVEKHILAAYLGMKAETFSRSQQQLKPYGITVTGQTITIEHIEQLREFVCNSCSESGSCETEQPGF